MRNLRISEAQQKSMILIKKVCNCEKSGNIEKIQESLPEMRKSLLKKVSFGKIDRNR